MIRLLPRARGAHTSLHAQTHLRGWVGALIALSMFVSGQALVPVAAEAKPPAAKRAKAKPARAKKPARARPAKEDAPAEPARVAATEERGESKVGESRADAQRKAAQDAAAGADAQVVREGDTQVKVMSFSGLDIEGRLKSPQLLYFVGRVRAEFDRPTLPHRSFMPELDGTTHTAPLQ